MILKIPFLLSTNYREVSKSNCNVLYFYDDITALQQFRLILEKKREMFKREIEKIQNFISEQLSVQSFPVDSATRIRNSLLAYQRALIQQARKDLRARYPEPVTINNLSYG